MAALVPVARPLPVRTVLLLSLGLVAACSSRPVPSGGTAQTGSTGLRLGSFAFDEQVPGYAKLPYEPFARENAVAIAVREWRAWGMRVNDNPPGPDMPVPDRADRQAGLWQRVGDYWWFGQNAQSQGSEWTGKYGSYGAPYSGNPPAWSAAFISYIMRSAGAGDRFPYSPLHATYINAAASRTSAVLQAQPPETYAPQQGDLICYGRRGAERLRFADLPASSFYGHCDMVIIADPGALTVIGGNVTAGVTMKHVPVTAAGTLAEPDGRVVDSRYPWFVVLRVLYDQPAMLAMPLGMSGGAASMPPPVPDFVPVASPESPIYEPIRPVRSVRHVRAIQPAASARGRRAIHRR